MAEPAPSEDLAVLLIGIVAVGTAWCVYPARRGSRHRGYLGASVGRPSRSPRGWPEPDRFCGGTAAHGGSRQQLSPWSEPLRPAITWLGYSERAERARWSTTGNSRLRARLAQPPAAQRDVPIAALRERSAATVAIVWSAHGTRPLVVQSLLGSYPDGGI
jgi:hypothetical protein